MYVLECSQKQIGFAVMPLDAGAGLQGECATGDRFKIEKG